MRDDPDAAGHREVTPQRGHVLRRAGQRIESTNDVHGSRGERVACVQRGVTTDDDGGRQGAHDALDGLDAAAVGVQVEQDDVRAVPHDRRLGVIGGADLRRDDEAGAGEEAAEVASPDLAVSDDHHDQGWRDGAGVLAGRGHVTSQTLVETRVA
jgi:hypothetical protein